MTQRYDLIVWDKIPQKNSDEKKTIARKVGTAKALDNGMIQYSNSVTNRAEADRILRRWARLLNDHLAEVKSTGT